MKEVAYYKVTHNGIVEKYTDWSEAYSRWMSFKYDAVLEIVYEGEEE